MISKEVKIEGMTCHHCVMAVQRELGKLDGVKVNDVQIGSAKIEYDESKVNENAIAEAIEEAGYKLVK